MVNGWQVLPGFYGVTIESDCVIQIVGGTDKIVGFASVYSCKTCGALVMQEDQTTHRQYHEFRGDPIK